MRGKVLAAGLDDLVDGITPAYAGKSTLRHDKGADRKDHPRVCGEETQAACVRELLKGSPPRMRGRVLAALMPENRVRITPAYAGKRTLRRCTTGFLRDHPRVCGEE